MTNQVEHTDLLGGKTRVKTTRKKTDKGCSMNEYIFLMHNDGEPGGDFGWETYISNLQERGHFNGGSAIGHGECVRRSGSTSGISSHLTGYIRVQAEDLNHAKALLDGNPVFEAGGTVEIRELRRE